MAEKKITARIVHKHDTEANWNLDVNANFIPKQGEIIVYDIDSNHTYERFKIGDGVTVVSSLPFLDPIKKLDKPTTPTTPSFVTINDVGFVDTKKVSDFLQKTGGNVTGNIYSTGEFTACRFTADEWLAAEGSYADKSAFIATALVSSVQGSPDDSYFTIVVDDTSKLFVNKVVALCNDKGLIYGGLSAIRIASIDTNTKTVRFNVPEIDGDTFWGTKIGLYSSTIDETLYRYDRISNDNNYLEFPNSSGTIALTPNAAPSEPSFIITAADRTPTWQSAAPILQDYVDDALLGG